MGKSVSILLLACLGIILFLESEASSEVVAVQMGDSRVEGKQEQIGNRTVNRFLGMPYAVPPLNQLRFRRTIPLQGFPEVFQAFDPRPACHQYTETPFPWYFNDTKKSEDCLYLNMWTPADASPQNQKAVLFWIHSGQFKLGSTNLRYYSGAVLAAEGDIIVVTVGYRLGVFGFLNTNTKAAPGNAGLYDVLEALKWVHKNIGYFGGDPSRITLYGEASSAVIVGDFTQSPLARGLYSGLIMDDGAPANLQNEFRNDSLQLAQELAERVGCATDDQDIDGNLYVTRCLKRVPAGVLEQAEFDMGPQKVALFYPIYGDQLLPRNPRRATFDGNFECKPLLTGNNRNAGSIYLPILQPDTFGSFGEKNKRVTKALANDLVDSVFEVLPDAQSDRSDGQDLKAKVKNSIFTRASEDNPYRLRCETYRSLGSLETVCPTVYYAEKCAEQGIDVYYYLFVHRYSRTPFASWMGVTLFSELQFVFGWPILRPSLYTEDEIELSHRMMKYWSTFVKTGKPDISWPKYSKEEPIYTVVGGGNATKKRGKGPHLRNCNLYREDFEKL